MKLAVLLGVDPTSILRWEVQGRRPFRRVQGQLEPILNSILDEAAGEP